VVPYRIRTYSHSRIRNVAGFVAMSLRLRNCCEFSDADPFNAAPRERDVLLHYVKHGPIQPAIGLLVFTETLMAAVSVLNGTFSFHGWSIACCVKRRCVLSVV